MSPKFKVVGLYVENDGLFRVRIAELSCGHKITLRKRAVRLGHEVECSVCRDGDSVLKIPGR